MMSGQALLFGERPTFDCPQGCVGVVLTSLLIVLATSRLN